jgi:hypothetical protein
VDFAKSSLVDLQFVIGTANTAEVIVFSLEDKDGTIHSWNIPLAGQSPGQLLRYRLNLGKAEKEDNAGKTQGLNLKKVSKWEIKGNWADPNVEVLLVKLTAGK